MKAEDIITKFPHHEAEMNKLLAQLRMIERLTCDAQERKERMNATPEVQEADFGMMNIHLHLREFAAYDDLLRWVIVRAMKFAAPSLSIEAAKLAQTIRGKGSVVTFRQVIELALAEFLPSAGQAAYEQMQKSARQLLPYKEKTIQALVRGRKLNLRYDRGWGGKGIDHSTDRALDALDALVQVVLGGAPAEMARGCLLRHAAKSGDIGNVIPISSEFFTSIKFYKNGGLDIEFESSDYAYQVGAVLLGLVEGLNKAA